MSEGGIISRLSDACATEDGTLMLINLDNFGLFNEIYGTDAGDRIIAKCAMIISEMTNGDDIKGSLGGDEFILFCKNLNDINELTEMLDYMNQKISEEVKYLLGEDTNVSIGASIGAVQIPEYGTNYEELFYKADLALDYVKQTGEHGCAFYSKRTVEEDNNRIEGISKIMDEADDERGALWLEYDYFSVVYKFFRRYLQTYGGSASKMLITVEPITNTIGEEHFKQVVRDFGKIINISLRKSDIMMQSGSRQFFLLLPEITELYIEKVKQRIEKRWRDVGLDSVMNIRLESEDIIIQNDNDRK